MALSRVSYEQTVAGTTDFTVTFDYIDKAHVKAYVDGVPATFSWLNTTTIKFAVAPPVGAIIKIERETERLSLLVDFQDGSTITEDQLDKAARQSFFISQESFDLYDKTIRGGAGEPYDAQSNRIANIADPSAEGDAVPYGFMENYVVNFGLEPANYTYPKTVADKTFPTKKASELQFTGLASLTTPATTGTVVTADGFTVALSDIVPNDSVKVPVTTFEYRSGTAKGGGSYFLMTLAKARTEKGNSSWVPDGYGDHYVGGGTSYVIVLRRRGVFDALQFGVYADGTTDDSLHLTRAVNYINALGGGTLLLPVGVYAIGTGNSARGVTVKSNVRIVGESRGGSILRRKLGSNTKVLSVASDTSGLPPERTKNVEVTNLTIDGQANLEPTVSGGGAHQTWEYGYNVDIRHASHVKVHNCNILNPIGDGFYIAMRCHDIHVYGNYISSTEAYNNNRNTRMGIAMLSGLNIFIHNNVIRDFLWYIDGEIDTTEEGFTGDGGGVFGFKNVHIYGNDCQTYSTLSKPEGGIYLYEHPSNGPTTEWLCEDIHIHHNNVGEQQRSSIRVDGSSATYPSKRVHIDNNECSKGIDNITLQHAADFHIVENVCRWADLEPLTGYNIRVYNIPNVTFLHGVIEGNTCVTAEIANIRVEGSVPKTKSLVIKDNVCNNSKGLNIATSAFDGRLVLEGNDCIATGTFSNIGLSAPGSAIDTIVRIKGGALTCNTGGNISFGNNNYVYVDGVNLSVGCESGTGGKFYTNEATTSGHLTAKGNTYVDLAVGFTNRNIDVISRINSYNVNRFSLSEKNVAAHALTIAGDRFARPQSDVCELTFAGNSLRTLDSPHSRVTLLFKDAGTVDHQLATGANSINTKSKVNVSASAGTCMTLIRDAAGAWWEV